MAELDLISQLEAILFVATEPLSIARLSEITGHDVGQVRQALEQLTTAKQFGGINISTLDGKYRLVSSPLAGVVVKRYLQDEAGTELSKAALETLAIVAYRGPLTKSAIEAIRGVSSEVMLKNLLARGLIVIAGKSTEPGRPARYGISHNFLQHFGLTSQSELPIVTEAFDEN